ncbi:FAD-dependent monooxygenase [Amycolatopsis carbonis]|uniref:FAD-dependent monooxygenase n=1 Tax=Amycolatopsis carbonis TaxID=715471 RepID=A0A9Y2II96_9PSEU|nr:FAD-dependent monooxygenase [Amycolatopsis sp. 2-15]WIX80267.1 FAD-dependent monooxygenase [Amycolatopsis sp. 2-15]
MPESVIDVFDRLVYAEPPAERRDVVETACVLGGSIAGLLAARVLADHAERVVIIERDELPADPVIRHAVPQGAQVHTLVAAGVAWLDRWLPGFSEEMVEAGATVTLLHEYAILYDGHRQASSDDQIRSILAGRPLIETRIRNRVTALPNVTVVRGQVTGLEFGDGAVTGVRYTADGADQVRSADLVVDAMGWASRVPDWLGRAEFDQPILERLATPLTYASAVFERAKPTDELPQKGVVSMHSPGQAEGGLGLAVTNAIEDDQWIVTVIGFDEDRPARTVDELRAVVAPLFPLFQEATSGAAARDIETYRQAESRRRRFTGLRSFPARLVSVGDAVASFNPIYGQGISSAALHASCLSAYLRGEPDQATPAEEFFRLQEVVVDAVWAVSASGDQARLDATNGREVPEDVLEQRQAGQQIVAAALVDGDIATEFNEVAFMLRHPGVLADPAFVARVRAVTEGMESSLADKAPLAE